VDAAFALQRGAARGQLRPRPPQRAADPVGLLDDGDPCRAASMAAGSPAVPAPTISRSAFTMPATQIWSTNCVVTKSSTGRAVSFMIPDLRISSTADSHAAMSIDR
jgi:hypothetical protein